MTRKEFIKKCELTKTTTKCVFSDGMTVKERTLYINPYGNLYVFYNNDLHFVRPYKSNEYVQGMDTLKGHLGAGYSWYK